MAKNDGISLPLVIFGSCFYFFAYAFAITGNCFVLSVCYKRSGSSSLRWFIGNLAIADLTFALLSILDIISFLWTWVGGQVTCKIQCFWIEACYTTSIMTLVLISFQRIKAVLHPFNARLSDAEGTKRKVVALWLGSLVVCSPLLYAYQVVTLDLSGQIICTNRPFGDLGRQIYYSIHAVCFFIVPLVYMIYAQTAIFLALIRSSRRVFPTQNTFATSYTNRHRKVAKTLAALTLAFIICWSPFMIVRTLMYFHLLSEGHVWRLSQLLVMLNTVLDPILYGIYGENLNFRQYLRRIITRLTFRQAPTGASAVRQRRMHEQGD
ncbi:unnamed protein product, partial [Porites evermanni]